MPGFYVLLLSSIIAVAISGLIVWLYVERGVVRRLGGLPHAMQRLIRGDLSVQVARTERMNSRPGRIAVVAFRDESLQRRALEAGARAHQ